MTIGIGVLASESKKRIDRIVLVSDSLGSYGDAYSITGLRKLMFDDREGIYAVGAGDLQHATDIVKKALRAIQELPQRTYGLIHDRIAYAAWDHRSARFKYDVLPEFGIAPTDHWQAEAKKSEVWEEVCDRWNDFDTGFQVIISTFDHEESACQFLIQPDGKVKEFLHPGFVAIGSGMDNALFWLAYRNQNITMGLRQSAYHAYEAKLMAELSPHVGKGDIELLIASDNAMFFLNSANPEVAGCPVSLLELEKIWKECGPKDTSNH